jgi:hemerythrin
MRLFKWTSANAIFVPELDAEHRTIFQLAEELRQAMEAGAAPERLVAMLRGLTAHAEEHFAHEERLMRATDCPFLRWHKGQHDTVRKRIKLFVPELETGNPEGAAVLLEFLSGWLRDHTGLTDRMMGAYVRNYERAHAAIAS